MFYVRNKFKNRIVIQQRISFVFSSCEVINTLCLINCKNKKGALSFSNVCITITEYLVPGHAYLLADICCFFFSSLHHVLTQLVQTFKTFYPWWNHIADFVTTPITSRNRTHHQREAKDRHLEPPDHQKPDPNWNSYCELSQKNLKNLSSKNIISHCQCNLSK